MTRRRRPGFTRGPRRCGAAASPRPSDASPTDAAAAAHGTPGDRPPAVLAVSRCRARQHHGQADAPAPGAPDRREDVTATRDGTPRIVRAGPSSQSTVLRHSRYAGRTFGAPLTLETSAGPAGLTARARPEARPEHARRTSAESLKDREQNEAPWLLFEVARSMLEACGSPRRGLLYRALAGQDALRGQCQRQAGYMIGAASGQRSRPGRCDLPNGTSGTDASGSGLLTRNVKQRKVSGGQDPAEDLDAYA